MKKNKAHNRITIYITPKTGKTQCNGQRTIFSKPDGTIQHSYAREKEPQPVSQALQKN